MTSKQLFGVSPDRVNKMSFVSGVEKGLQILGYLSETKDITLESRANAFIDLVNDFGKYYNEYLKTHPEE